MAGAVVTCPKCQCQLEVKLSFAAGPKRAVVAAESASASTSTEPASKGLTKIGEWLEFCVRRSASGLLNAWEEEFVSSLMERYEEYGDRVKLSEKQMEILERIADGKRGR